jgi:hypothetical protein
VLLNIAGVVGFAIPVARLVKMDDQRHDLTLAQLLASPSLAQSACQQFLFPLGRKSLPEIIDMAEQLQ